MMPSTPLQRSTAKKMSGEPTPLTFAKYCALRAGCGVAELADWSSLTVTGADRQSFLHNFSTNDVKRLKPGESCEALLWKGERQRTSPVLLAGSDDQMYSMRTS